MFQRQYHELNLMDAGINCDFQARSMDDDETLRLAMDHACRDCNICEITPDLRSRLQGSIKTTWCNDEGKCYDEPKIEVIPPWGYLS